MEHSVFVLKEMRQTWKDLVIINGRVLHSHARILIEHDNHTLEMALRKWMQHNHTDNWSKGEYIIMFIIFPYFQ